MTHQPGLIAFLSLLAFSCVSFPSFAQEKGQTSRPVAEWNYDVYRKTYPEQVSSIRTSQSEKQFLEPAAQFCRTGERLAKSQRELSRRILSVWRDLLGPSKRNTGPLKARVLEMKDFPNYIRQKVEYEADPGEPVRAWLFVPKHLRGKAPAMLCLHQTVPEGKDQAAGLTTSPELAYGPLLAERGFVTLCPDAICFGERYQVGGNFYCHYGDAVRIYQGNAGRSIMSKMIDDAMRAVDYLVSRPEVDKKRIGSIGHSHGGYGTLFAMAYDERIRVGVVSCGFTSFRADPTPDRWYRKTALIPRLGAYEEKMKETPVDFHQLFAAIAPRALFISAAMKDSIFPGVGDVNWMRENVDGIYENLKSPGAFELYAFDGAHAFTPEARDRAWTFLNTHLKPSVK